MKRFSMVSLYEESGMCLVYDCDTGKYLQYDVRIFKGDSYKWMLFQPFMIFAVEVIADHLMDIHFRSRVPAGLLVFLLSAIIVTALVEVQCSYYGNLIRAHAKPIQEPPCAGLKECIGKIPDRLKNTCRITGVLAAVTAVLLILFIKTGVAILMLFAIGVYFIMYFIWAIARPGLLKKYSESMREKT